MTTKHFFFDLDNTLARSKSCVAPEHIPLFRALSDVHDTIVVSGQSGALIADHMTSALNGTYFVLGQNGNEARAKDDSIIWYHPLTSEQRTAVMVFLKKVREHITFPIVDENDLVDDRGCEIAYSLIGHHRPIEIKEAFDPDFSLRQKILAELASDVEVLREADVEVRAGGTTVFDIFALGKNKGNNIKEFVALMQWSIEDCLYIGDALMPGGNDETVVGIIPTHAVKEYHETFAFIANELNVRD